MTTEQTQAIQEATAKLEELTQRFYASMDFVNRHELEMPRSVRDLLVRLREAMRIADAADITDREGVERRTSAVKDLAEEIQAEVRRLVA